ncbi:MAG: GNAT family N-acetyltransferase [Gemmatimonadetes bacterium]|nr:GNAT family N-acetyltransferase [Gemmatimonadota bacterium]
MSETFRAAREDEIKAVAQLVAHSFVARSASQHEDSLRKGPWGGVETLWVAEEGGRLIGACQLLPLKQWIGGATLPVMGLGTVTVAPTHRRRGLAARLIKSAMAEARARGDLATALYPFRVSFYERLGYGRAGEAHQYRVPPEVIPDAPERSGVKLMEDETDAAAIRGIYERWVRGQSGQLERTDEAWARILAPDERAAVLYRNDAGEAEGYAIVRYRADIPLEERYLEVQERAWLTSRARRGLYAWLGTLGDQWRILIYRAHVNERFGDRIEEPRIPPGSEPGWNLWFPSAVLLRGPMFRLLDLPGAFRARPRFGRGSLTVDLEVEDQHIGENAGHWRLHLEEGKPSIERAQPGGADVTVKVSIDILSRMFIGALTPSEAVDQSAIWIEGLDMLPALNAAFSLPRPWTFDGF